LPLVPYNIKLDIEVKSYQRDRENKEMQERRNRRRRGEIVRKLFDSGILYV
jgi:hypothetical protein